MMTLKSFNTLSCLILTFIFLSACSGESEPNTKSNNDIEEVDSSEIAAEDSLIYYDLDADTIGDFYGIKNENWYPSYYSEDEPIEDARLFEFVLDSFIVNIEVEDFWRTEIDSSDGFRSNSIDIQPYVFNEWNFHLTVSNHSGEELFKEKVGRHLFYNAPLDNYEELDIDQAPDKDFESFYYSGGYSQSFAYGYATNEKVRIEFAYYDDISYGENGYHFEYNLNLKTFEVQKQSFWICTLCEGEF